MLLKTGAIATKCQMAGRARRRLEQFQTRMERGVALIAATGVFIVDFKGNVMVSFSFPLSHFFSSSSRFSFYSCCCCRMAIMNVLFSIAISQCLLYGIALSC